MIGFLKGRVIDWHSEGLIVDVGGVGYELQCSANTLDECGLGEDVALHVHTHVREDAISLFGFSTALEKRLFLSLTKVNGVGPKLAVKALSAGPLSRLVEMIEAGDVKGLSGLPKVGKKTAEQIILTLKGKLVMDEAERSHGGAGARSLGTRGEIISALVNLGFRLPDVEKAVEEMPAETDLQTGIRQGLQALTGQF
ncbi:MAG: Holliday junction branch migration protein RuvA [Bdellovibrionaceae bacterium]|nr:Holliday junction branch migration protein RuvA [Pseudobdellovibrionaceae bacterium]